ncbi:lipopolysaccharide biosynthesis protein [Clostridium disporicum]|uniref:Polysaccharide biosynthesis protein n=1 Tax=Clostridium disporicum TaxID=84024 RepID=A0A174EYA8_9CLOT|nr:lipopolysaccharide biosynthesis protein [Clostridium disporicum]CUO42784.1 polysaccharide biosynthesis protein [Clostridium disporicum]
MSDISIKKAAVINFISRYSNIFVQLIINSILARLLTPDDYGVVAVINVFISFFTIIADMGIGPAIIQNKDLNKKQISDIFIFTIFTGIVIAVGFALFSYPISIFYNNTVYISLGRILAIGIFFNILNIVPNALLLKNKQFKSLGIRTVIITVVGGIITIVIALGGAKYYALVINSILVAVLTFIFNIYYSNMKIYYSFSIDSIKVIKDFSSYQFGFNFINYFSRNTDNLLIGKVLGEVPLGYYDKAYKLMLYPVQNLTHVITPVLHPILSDYQSDRDYIYETYMKIVKILSLVGIFFTVFCFFASNEIILIMFGKQWSNSIIAFKILSLSIWPQMVTSSTGVIFQSLNATKQLFVTGLITTAVNVMLIVTGLCMGKIEYVAMGVVISYILSFLISYFILIKKVFNKSLFKYILSFRNDIIVLLIVALGLAITNIKINNILISVIYKFVVSCIFYIIALFITKEYKSLIYIIKREK